MSDDLKVVTLFGIFILAFTAILATALLINEEMKFPKCSEDVVIIGGGDFVDGRWTYYSCGPARDDYLYE